MFIFVVFGFTKSKKYLRAICIQAIQAELDFEIWNPTDKKLVFPKSKPDKVIDTNAEIAPESQEKKDVLYCVLLSKKWKCANLKI